mmetsp:Transcript_10889/g.13166  ORF Transcript_10889/g.13166 Transcript_10889/m.13166 type:complete len:353 (+) Transcript_10889:11-1069(+)
MGLCSSSEAAANDKNIDLKNAKDHEASKNKIKLLLLGAGESGKSTLFKQMNILYGKGLDDKEKQKILPFIGFNVMEGLQMLCRGVEDLELEDKLLEENKPLFKEILDLTVTAATPDATMVSKVQTLWKDPAIVEAWKQRSSLQVSESVSTFVNRLETYTAPDYVPTQEDVLLCRIRTTGITSQTFVVDGVEFEMYDVGGQKSERKKWANCFDTVNAVMFVAALSEYDHTMFEDESENRMNDAINLFKWVCEQSAFSKSSILLFLNKKDLFMEKIKVKSIESVPCFNDYKGKPNDFEDGVEYFKTKFLEQTKNDLITVYPHVTCATDSGVVQFVFDSCKDIILKDALGSVGLF